MNLDFKSMYLGEFTVSDRDIRLHDIAKEYHESTELYDSSVCSFKNERGVATPSNPHEFGLINRNAESVKKRLLSENYDIGREELRVAIVRYEQNSIN